MKTPYVLRLYITGQTSNANRALKNLQKICQEELNGQCDVEIIDVFQDPQRAEADHIIATPTLLRKLPLPIRKIIGDLSDRERVLIGLDLKPKPLNKG